MAECCLCRRLKQMRAKICRSAMNSAPASTLRKPMPKIKKIQSHQTSRAFPPYMPEHHASHHHRVAHAVPRARVIRKPQVQPPRIVRTPESPESDPAVALNRVPNPAPNPNLVMPARRRCRHHCGVQLFPTPASYAEHQCQMRGYAAPYFDALTWQAMPQVDSCSFPSELVDNNMASAMRVFAGLAQHDAIAWPERRVGRVQTEEDVVFFYHEELERVRAAVPPVLQQGRRPSRNQPLQLRMLNEQYAEDIMNGPKKRE